MVAAMQETSEIVERENGQAPVTLTQAAVEKLAGLMEEKGVRATHGLRVFVRGGGCSGLQYGMAFDDNPRPIDHVFEEHGLRVIIDPQSLQYMTGSSIDYVDDPTAGGFHIENPNVLASCGGGSCSSCR